MTTESAHERGRRADRRTASAFTLIELLTVVAIISLLIGMLVPGLAKAREQARKTKTGAMYRAIGVGLDQFRAENEQEFHGYPPSAIAEEQTETGAQNLYGAQWLVRYLMGKDLQGYVPRRAVPPDLMVTDPADTWQQKKWYDGDAFNGRPLERVGPYVRPEGIKLKRPDQLPNKPTGAIPGVDDISLRQVVMLDAFDLPILYYRADQRQTNQPNVSIARLSRTSAYNGVYTFDDNALFTGIAVGTSVTQPGWDFGFGTDHPLGHFAQTDPPETDKLGNDPKTFVYYILDRNAYEATYNPNAPAGKQRKAIPQRRDSFLLISPGKDGLYGTLDDVTNF